MKSNKFSNNHISKVAIFCDFFNEMGGTEKYNLLLAEGLASKGIDVRVYIGERTRSSYWVDKLKSNNISYREPATFYSYRKDRIEERKFISTIVDEINEWSPDIIHAHPFKKMAIEWLANSRANHDIPIVATEWTVPSVNSSHWFEPDIYKYINRVDAYIATCDAIKLGLTEYLGYKGSIYNIPHLLNTDNITLPEFTVSSSYSVGCISRLSPEKGLVYLLGSWKKVIHSIPNATLHIYGDGNDKLMLVDLCKSLGIENSVHFEGIFDPTEIHDVTKKHAIYVQPSLFESIPTSLIELMMYGRIVIATNVGGVPELIDNNVNGYIINPASTDELANKLISVMSNTTEDSLLKMSIAASSTVRDRYDYYKAIEQIIDVYNRLLKSS